MSVVSFRIMIKTFDATEEKIKVNFLEAQLCKKCRNLQVVPMDVVNGFSVGISISGRIIYRKDPNFKPI